MKLKDALINDNQKWAEEQDRKKAIKFAYTLGMSYHLKANRENVLKAYKEYEENEQEQ